MSSFKSVWPQMYVSSALMALVAVAGCSHETVDTPAISNVTVEPDTWSSSTEKVDLTLTADVVGFDNSIASVTGEMTGTSYTFTLAKGADISTGEHWEVTKTLNGPFTAGNYEIVVTATDSEGDSITSDTGAATVTITND